MSEHDDTPRPEGIEAAIEVRRAMENYTRPPIRRADYDRIIGPVHPVIAEALAPYVGGYPRNNECRDCGGSLSVSCSCHDDPCPPRYPDPRDEDDQP